MAYTPGTLSQIASTLESDFGLFVYETTDSVATVEGTNYFSDGKTRGMNQLGCVIIVLSGATPSVYVSTILQVSALQVGGNGVTAGTVLANPSQLGTGAAIINTAVTTVGAATLSGAAIAGGVITRTGSTGAYSDTTDTAANIIAAMATKTIGNSWWLTIANDVPFAETILAGSGVTLTGESVIPGNSSVDFLVTYTGAGAISMYGLTAQKDTALPAAKYTTSSVTTGSIAAGVITGAMMSYWLQSGATPGNQLVRTAAQMLADIPGAMVGDSFGFRIINTGAGTLTLAADAGPTVTMTGTMTVAQNTWRDFILTFNTATTATVQSVGIGTQS